MFKNYKVDRDTHNAYQQNSAQKEKKTGKSRVASVKFEVVKTLSFPEHFNTSKGIDFVKHSYAKPSVDFIPYP
jgi:hypothetical protein